MAHLDLPQLLLAIVVTFWSHTLQQKHDMGYVSEIFDWTGSDRTDTVQ